jgi:hypothetical protein
VTRAPDGVNPARYLRLDARCAERAYQSLIPENGQGVEVLLQQVRDYTS